jgi:folylpolyglutamate synthase
MIPQVKTTKLGLAGEHQIENANLAVHLVRGYMQEKSLETAREETSLTEAEIEGLASTRWPGRCQRVADPRRPQTTWFLDGAHTVESLRCCFNWFVSQGVGLPAEGATSSPGYVGVDEGSCLALKIITDHAGC